MPRPKNTVPAYRLHKQSGQAIVTLRLPGGGRRDVTLGKFGSPESRREYERILAETRVAPEAAVPSTADGPAPTVNELLLAFLQHADRYYVDPEGRPTKEAACFREALKPVRELYGHTPAKEFGPLALKAVRKAMADAGMSRGVCNARTNRIRRAFKWAASEELIPFAAYQSLTTVRGFVRGRGEARETEPVKPVDPGDVERTIPFMPPAPAAMTRVQLLTGMRPGEVCRMNGAEIDRSGPVWVYRPSRHKTAYRGRIRTVFLGPKAQEVLTPWLAEAGDGYVFSPARERDKLYVQLRAARKSKVQPSQVSRKRPQAERLPGERYTTDSYGQAVAKSVVKANRKLAKTPGAIPIPAWRPNRIRHTRATEVRAKYGLEAAGAVLGHDRMSVTEVYAEKDLSLALKVAAEAG